MDAPAIIALSIVGFLTLCNIGVHLLTWKRVRAAIQLDHTWVSRTEDRLSRLESPDEAPTRSAIPLKELQ